MRTPDFLSRWLIDFWRWFALGTVVLILALGYFFVLAGKIESVRTDGLLKRTQADEQLAADSAYKDALQASAKAFEQKISASDRATIEEFIPTGSDFPSILLTVQDMAKRAGLQLTDVAVTEIGQVAAARTDATVASQSTSTTSIAQAATVQGVNLRTQDVNVTVGGLRSYDEVKNFVKVIESSRRLFDVVSLNFNLSGTAVEGEGATDGSPVTFSLRTYYLPATN